MRIGWTEPELIEVIKLYCITTFGRLHSRNPTVVKLSEELGRTPGAVALKMTNFAALDPTIERKGMGNFSKLDERVWSEFFANMDAYLSDSQIDHPHMMAESATDYEPFPEGVDVLVAAKARIGQSFFRSMILASYDNKCALTDIDSPELLVASHIRPWADNRAERTNPRNGLLLNRLHDRAFDLGLMTFEADLTVRFSKRLSAATRDKLSVCARSKLRLPRKFAPDPDYLKFHRDVLFE